MAQLQAIKGVPSIAEQPDMRLLPVAAKSYNAIYDSLHTIIPQWVVNSAFRSLNEERSILARLRAGDKTVFKPEGVTYSFHNSGRAVDISTRGLKPKQINILIQEFRKNGWQVEKEPNQHLIHFELEHPTKSVKDAALEFNGIPLAESNDLTSYLSNVELQLQTTNPEHIHRENAVNDVVNARVDRDIHALPEYVFHAGATKIGDVWLYVPPTQITVTEYNTINSIPSVRTIGNPKVGTGNQEIRIEMELYFTDIADFNRTLRPILAQMRRTPFLTLENDFIRRLLTVKTDSRGLVRQDMYEEAIASINRIIHSVNKNTPNDEFIKLKENRGPDATSLLTPTKRVRPSLDMANPSPPSDPDDDATRQRLRSFFPSSFAKAEDLISESAEPLFSNPQPIEQIAGTSYGLPTNNDPIPVVIHSVRLNTIDGFPQSIQCNLQLNLFNYRPYSLDFSFLKTEEDVISQIYFNKAMRNTLTSDSQRLASEPQEVHRTINCSESIPFKKYYQGLLAEYNTEGTWGYTGPHGNTDAGSWIPKTYSELPYTPPRNFELPVMQEASFGAFQKLKLTGKTTTLGIGAITKEVNNRLQKIRKIILAMTLESDDDNHTLLTNLWSSIRQNWRFMIHYVSTIKTELSFALAKLPLDAIGIDRFKQKNQQILVWDDTAEEYIPFERYLDNIFKNGADKEKMLQIVDSFIKVTRQFATGKLLETEDRTIDFSRKGVVIKNIGIGLENKLIPIPILSYNLPTYQHTGGSDYIITINLTTDDLSFLQDLRTLSIMTQYTRKAALAQASVADMSEKARRSLIYSDSAFTVDILPEGYNIFHALGIRKVMLGDVIYSTIKGNPGTYSATISLYQADVELLKTEVLVSRVGASFDNIQKALAWLTVTSEGSQNLNTNPPEQARLVNVKDGDTLEVRLADSPNEITTVRILGVNTAESIKYLDYEAGVRFGAQTGGKDASDFVRSILKRGDTITLISDPYQPNTDIYDRLLRYVEFLNPNIEPVIQGLSHDLGAILISHGHSDFDANYAILKYFEYSELADRRFKFIQPDSTIAGTRPDKRTELKRKWNDLRRLITESRATRRTLHIARQHNEELGPIYGSEYLTGISKSRRRSDTIGAKTQLHLLNFEFQQKLKFLLMTPGAISVLNSDRIEIDGKVYHIHHKLETNSDKPINIASYKDLALPSFAQYRLGTLDTPADFYFYRSSVVDPSIVNGIALDIASKYSYIRFLENANKVVRGEATTHDRSQELYNLIKTLIKSKNKVNRRSQLRDLGKKIHYLNNELRARELDSAKGQSVAKDFHKRVVTEFSENVNAIKNDEKAVAQASNLPLNKNLANLPTSDIQEARDILQQHKNELSLLIEGLGNDASAEASMAYTFGSFTRESLTETTDTLTDAMSNMRSSMTTALNNIGILRKNDKMFHMARAFPTFALYFVEEDKPEWLFFNDVYGYDSIKSIDIISNRESPSDTAIIHLSNLTGTLTSPISRFQTENLAADSTDREQTVTSFFVQPGTRIIIKLGFENNPDDMELLFDGAITTVKPGDELEIIAQSWGAQLNRPIGIRKALHYDWNHRLNSYGSVASSILANTGGLGHYGGKTLFGNDISRPEQQHLTFLTRTLINPFINYAKTNSLPGVARYLSENTIDDNVYLKYAHITNLMKFPDNINGEISEDAIRKMQKRYKKQAATEWKFSWYIYQQTAWDAINELLLYHPDYIVKSFPYNDDALGTVRSTLYIGPWDGYFKFTDKFNEELSDILSDRVEKEKTLQLKILKKQFPHAFESPELDNADIDRVTEYYLGKNEPSPLPNINRTTGAVFTAFGTNVAERVLSTISNVLNVFGAEKTPIDTAESILRSELSVLGGLGDLAWRRVRREQLKQKLKAIRKGGLLPFTRDRNPEDLADLPGYKRAASSHIITSRNHIIANNIRADANNLYNHIVLRFPVHATDKINEQAKKKWKSSEFIVDDGIPPEYRRTMVSFQKNVNKTWKDHLILQADKEALRHNTDLPAFIPSYMTVGNNLLANSLRYMYTGELIVTMSPEIKTWDKVYIYDEITQMSGLIGVRQVHHHFDAEQGAWTAITPDLIVHQRNYNHIFEDKYMVGALGRWSRTLFPNIEPYEPVSGADLLDALAGKNPWYAPPWTPWGRRSGIFNATSAVAIALGGTSAIVSGINAPTPATKFIGIFGSLVGGAVAGSYYGQKWADKIWTLGVGRYFQQQMVQMTGLWYKGKPFHAGLEGARRENILVHAGDIVEPFQLFGAMASRYNKVLTPSFSSNIGTIR